MVTDQVIRMAFVRALLQLQLDVLVHSVAHSVQDSVTPRRTTPETQKGAQQLIQLPRILRILRQHPLHVIVVRARLKLERGRKGRRSLQHLVKGPLLVHHQLQLIPLDQCAQLIRLHHVADLLRRCRRLARQPEVEVTEPKHITARGREHRECFSDILLVIQLSPPPSTHSCCIMVCVGFTWNL